MIQAALSRMRRAHPDHMAIARGIVYVGVFLLLGKAAGAIKEMAIAYRYGVSVEVDAYVFLLTILAWPGELAMGLLMGVAVPLVAAIRATRPDALDRFRRELLGFILVAGTIACVIVGIALMLVLHRGWFGVPPQIAAVARSILPAMIVVVPAAMLVSLWSVWTATTGRHANTLVEGVPALVIAGVVIVFGGDGVMPLVWGLLAGYALHVAALGIPLARQGEIATPRLGVQSPEWRAFMQGFGLVLGSQALMNSTPMIDQFFAARLGEGAIATLGYANRILALVTGLGATAVGRSMLPVFSRARATGDGQLRRVALQWCGLMFAVGVVSSVVTWLCAPFLVRLLLERGAFGAEETVMVASLIRHGVLYLPFYFAGLVLVSYCASHARYDILFWSGITGFVVKVAGNVLLTPWFGVNGLMLAWALVYAVNAALFLTLVRRTR